MNIDELAEERRKQHEKLTYSELQGIKVKYKEFALAVILSALRDKDEYFFKTEWGKSFLTLAGIENRADKMKLKKRKSTSLSEIEKEIIEKCIESGMKDIKEISTTTSISIFRLKTYLKNDKRVNTQGFTKDERFEMAIKEMKKKPITRKDIYKAMGFYNGSGTSGILEEFFDYVLQQKMLIKAEGPEVKKLFSIVEKGNC